MLVSFLLLMASAIQAVEVDELVPKLVGADAHERAVARQLLPHHGVAAAHAVLPLLSNGDPAIAHAAFDILMDIGNRVSAPGRETERRQVTDLYMQLIAAERSESVKIVGLRLLERLVPPGYDVKPIAQLFADTPVIQDKARTALERIGTEEARAALRAALPHAESQFQWVLLTSLYELRDEKSLPQCRELTKSADWRVRSRAARGLTWQGNPDDVPLIKEVIKIAADEKARANAVDSLLRMAMTLSAKPGTRAAARDIYLELLTSSEFVWREAALAGLGRVGDGSCVAPMLAAANEKSLMSKVAISLLEIAELLSRGGEKEKAIECCQKVIALEPGAGQVERAVGQLKILGVAVETAPAVDK